MRISDWSSDVCSSDLRVENARLDLMHLAAGAVLDRALAGDAVDRLQAVLVVHRQFGALVDRGDVEAEAHGVAFQQQATAVPSLPEPVAVAVLGAVGVTDDHGAVSSLGGGCGTVGAAGD